MELMELLEKGDSLTHSLTDNLKSRDASASKNLGGDHGLSFVPPVCNIYSDIIPISCQEHKPRVQHI